MFQPLVGMLAEGAVSLGRAGLTIKLGVSMWIERSVISLLGILGFTLIMFGLEGCEGGGAAAGTLKATSSVVVVTPSPSPSMAPLGPCSSHPLKGSWRNVVNASDVIEFRDDCTGYAVLCNVNFTYSTLTGSDLPVVEQSRTVTLVNSCWPTLFAYNATRLWGGYLSPAMNAGKMRLAPNYNGGMEYLPL
jgi:hypothetical protein